MDSQVNILKDAKATDDSDKDNALIFNRVSTSIISILSLWDLFDHIA